MSDGGELSAPRSREPIRYGTVLVVEGRDMFGFFLALLQQLGLQNQVEVRNGGGITDLYDYLVVLPNIAGFDGVASLGVVCDCETNPAGAFADLCQALRRAGLPVPTAVGQATLPPPPPRVAVTLLPDANTSGMLETLLWRSLLGDQLIVCVEEYLDCVRKQSGRTLVYGDKSRVYTYVAGREQPWLLLGQAARAGYFPWASSAFDEIKAFLQGLVGTTP